MGEEKKHTHKKSAKNWPGVYECLHGCCKEQDHTGAAERSATLFLFLHRVAGLEIWVHKPQGESVGVVPLHAEEARDQKEDYLK